MRTWILNKLSRLCWWIHDTMEDWSLALDAAANPPDQCEQGEGAFFLDYALPCPQDLQKKLQDLIPPSRPPCVARSRCCGTSSPCLSLQEQEQEMFGLFQETWTQLEEGE